MSVSWNGEAQNSIESQSGPHDEDEGVMDGSVPYIPTVRQQATSNNLNSSFPEADEVRAQAQARAQANNDQTANNSINLNSHLNPEISDPKSATIWGTILSILQR
jgi:hypothetical protein